MLTTGMPMQLFFLSTIITYAFQQHFAQLFLQPIYLLSFRFLTLPATFHPSFSPLFCSLQQYPRAELKYQKQQQNCFQQILHLIFCIHATGTVQQRRSIIFYSHLQFFPIPSQMYKNVPLTPEQILELKAEVNKVLETNMEAFATKASRLPQLHERDFDALYSFSQAQHIRTQKTLQSLADFAFTVLSNADLIWQQVHHREGKLLQVRQSLTSATNFMEEMRAENEEMRSRLEEAETYIQWVEEEKEYLDAIYYDRSQPINRCVSERNLHWHDDSKKKSPNYEKLKGYIEGLKEERLDMERQLMLLAHKYETKCEEARKANALVEHLVDRLNRKTERRDFLDSLSSSRAREIRNDMTDDLLRILEKTEMQQSTTSVRQSRSLFEEEGLIGRKLPSFDSFPLLPDLRSPHQDCSLARYTKDACVGTDCFGRKAAACQTHEEEGRGDLRISINVGGEVRVPEQDKIVKIISELHIERQIESRLRGEKSEQSEEKTAASGKMNRLNNTLLSTYEYYRNRLVASRIKKYRFSKPDPAPSRLHASPQPN